MRGVGVMVVIVEVEARVGLLQLRVDMVLMLEPLSSLC